MSLTRRAMLLAIASYGLNAAAAAAPTRYKLDPTASKVAFRFTLGGAEQTGTMPVHRAEILIDPDNLAASKVDVEVHAADARTALFFATEALVGPKVLDAARFPTIRFVSDKVQLAQDGRLSGGARISGRLTLRGVTRSQDLTASIYRPPGSDPNDLQSLTVLLSGQLSRADFGATGYPELVTDNVGLDITAVIRAAN